MSSVQVSVSTAHAQPSPLHTNTRSRRQMRAIHVSIPLSDIVLTSKQGELVLEEIGTKPKVMSPNIVALVKV